MILFNRGSIAVEEFVSVAHVGARLAGSFSRADYEKTLLTPGGGKLTACGDIVKVTKPFVGMAY